MDGDDAFLLADKNLDVQRYNDTYTKVTWKTCTMRAWLNSTFLNNAFSESEQLAICNTTTFKRSFGGKDTVDKVYLLSVDEVRNPSYGFISKRGPSATRRAYNTAYVAAGGELKAGGMYHEGSSDAWWLRSPGDYRERRAASIYPYGLVEKSGNCVDNNKRAVRPALHLDLSVSSGTGAGLCWGYAGVVTSNGGGTGNVVDVGMAALKKSFWVSWKKVFGAGGYELWYSTSSNFKNKKRKMVKRARYIIKNPKSAKVYFVKVRSYIVKDGKKMYEEWSRTVKKKAK